MHKSNFIKNLKILKISFKEIYKLQHFVLPVTIFNALFKSISPFINIYMSARIIDELLVDKNVKKLIFLVTVTIILDLIIYLISAGLEHINTILKSVVAQNQDMRMNEKVVEMDYEYVENPEIHSLRTKIKEADNFNGGGIPSLIRNLENMVKGLITVIASIALVINLFNPYAASRGQLKFINSVPFSCFFLISILIGTIITLRLRTKADKYEFKYYNKVMDCNRSFSFYFYELMDYNVGKEIRLYNEKDIIDKELGKFCKSSGEMFNGLGSMNGKYDGIGALISSVCSGTIYIFVGLKALIGAITIGSIVQYAGGINQFMAGSKDILTSFNAIMNNNQYLQLYIDFINIKSEKRKGTLPVEKRDDDEYEIEFKNVSFKYPGTDIFVLKNVSMKLKIGERLAIVGMNGSGKTTFIKLLCRLYDPDEGEIRLNGINIKKYNYDEYMKLFSIVFQDFKLFSFTLGQNVAGSVSFDEASVKSVLEEVGFEKRLRKMTKGISTPLYKDFDEDGVEISGGEAQKIALARALYRDAPIIILDEPTAALDPIAEFEIYSKFNEIIGTKTAFYISHRLSSCRFCDEIAVFDKGKIVQKGNHEKLLEDVDGKYYELWNSQAKYYNDEESA